ncbi:hypothetical protein [Nonomuraea guangzhouensis]|uniref:Uncharacterized protein n=1 Tax=Nonomuraea guangzhouensis TaxID=1291555 RepID=A0ABW4GXA5_9ACTN|nr:hypothetical protein [Nonomuraea guangzhouensis]
MADVIVLLAGGVLISVVSFGCGWWLRSRRAANADAGLETKDSGEWQVLEIIYRDEDRTKEWYRHLNYTRYSSYEEARRKAKRCEDEDTLKNVFNREYVAVKAP